ncbi:GNAT family N-acetyltransferase [Paenibacillus nasutitermitis]|uniref:Ribosomal-protein-serine acetyltransferase n=1 Tax=Paenibacillus nasutitermitis TaxID=1652958 RepID=A0A916YPP2_9BACL|nr:GNAT family N-acetyltransferase [Paenibacillus nasutitermitis]GGD53945.1 ribosomal-protein-serine acetyltransferase [Paenibacillus nasutitermitis]
MSDVTSAPILRSFPEQFESDRLLIRAPLWNDGILVNEAVKESIEELRPWMPWADKIPSEEESEINIRQSRLQFLERTDLRLLIFLKQTGDLVSSSGLHRINWVARKFEIGYWIRTSLSGKGYMTEAVDAITTFAIDELQANRIEIRCDSRNFRSERIAQRLGFILEGILRNNDYAVDGSLRSTKIFSKVRGIEY